MFSVIWLLVSVFKLCVWEYYCNTFNHVMSGVYKKSVDFQDMKYFKEIIGLNFIYF